MPSLLSFPFFTALSFFFFFSFLPFFTSFSSFSSSVYVHLVSFLRLHFFPSQLHTPTTWCIGVWYCYDMPGTDRAYGAMHTRSVALWDSRCYHFRLFRHDRYHSFFSLWAPNPKANVSSTICTRRARPQSHFWLGLTGSAVRGRDVRVDLCDVRTEKGSQCDVRY